MLIIGSHVSFGSEQLLLSTKQAISFGANAFMFYTGAPQNTIRRSIDASYTNSALELMRNNGIDINNVICHAPYIINLASVDVEKHRFACDFLAKEIKRCEELGVNKIVLHPGSANKEPRDEAIGRIIDGLNAVVNESTKVMVLLETMAGKGSECGSTFEELKTIIDSVNEKDKIGVCIDTCHMNDVGYDINDFDKLMVHFDNVIGLDKIKCIHLNDSKNTSGAKKDRHANFGYGTIGFDALMSVVNYEKLKDVPKILETPYTGVDENDKERLYPPYKFEIEMIRNGKFEEKLFEKIYNFYK